MIRTLFALFADLLRLLTLALRSRGHLAAENLFLRKQLACYVERKARPRRLNNAVRIALVCLSRFVASHDLLTVVRPDTLIRWHRNLYRLFWRAKSRARGRPRIPVELQRLILEMATANRTWGEERIASELRLKLGLTLSPRTVRRYMPTRPRTRGGESLQSWATFLKNHAGSVVACDFFLVVTVTFRRLYVFVLLDIETRCVVHWNVTEHPTPNGRSSSSETGCPSGMPLTGSSYTTATQSSRRRSTAPFSRCRCRCSRRPDGRRKPTRIASALLGPFGASAFDWVIPLNERHLRQVLAEWVNHYNSERPHSALGHGVPEEPTRRATPTGHQMTPGQRVVAHPRLGGLHHDYRLEPLAA